MTRRRSLIASSSELQINRIKVVQEEDIFEETIIYKFLFDYPPTSDIIMYLAGPAVSTNNTFLAGQNEYSLTFDQGDELTEISLITTEDDNYKYEMPICWLKAEFQGVINGVSVVRCFTVNSIPVASDVTVTTYWRYVPQGSIYLSWLNHTFTIRAGTSEDSAGFNPNWKSGEVTSFGPPSPAYDDYYSYLTRIS